MKHALNLFWVLAVVLVALEGSREMFSPSHMAGQWPLNMLGSMFEPLLRWYEPKRSWVLYQGISVPLSSKILPHWSWILCVFAVSSAGVMVGLRRASIWVEEHVRQPMIGASFRHLKVSFPFRSFDASKFVSDRTQRARGTFLGLNLRKKPVCLSARARSTHVQIMGRTGSGKSELLKTMMFQDMAAGRGVFFLDGKGESSMRSAFAGMARQVGRLSDVKIFDLVDAERSWHYNPARLSDQHSPLVRAEKLFSIYPCSDPFYRGVHESFFTTLILVAHSTGCEFTFRDLHDAVQRPKALDILKTYAKDEQAIQDLECQIEALGKNYAHTMAGLETWLRRYAFIDQLNAYSEGRHIDVEEVVEQNQLVYVRLPAGYRPIFAAAIGRLFLQELQFVASVRQVTSDAIQQPFAVYADEFSVFADITWIQAINKARSANLWWTISHQSKADLEAVSVPFCEGVLDNCRTRIVLAQRNQELCQRLADELGTVQVVERTERETVGPWMSRRRMGEASTRLVDEYRLHPNRIKNLHPYGQGYVVLDQNPKGQPFEGVNFGLLPVDSCEVSPPSGSPSQNGLRLWSKKTLSSAEDVRKERKGDPKVRWISQAKSFRRTES